MKKMKLITAGLAVTLAMSCLAGCGNETKTGAGEKLTYWMPMTANISVNGSNFGDLPVAKSWSERTGVEVEYIHPSLTNVVEKFNLLLSSGDLPDIMEYYWGSYPGGPSKAIEDGVIIPLNDLIDKNAPNLKKIYEENPDVARAARTDNGDYFSAGIVAVEEALHTSGGVIIRQDWLDDLGMDMPETIPEWYEVLKAFKEQKGATAPLYLSFDAVGKGAFTGAYGIVYGFYVDDNGKVHYGPGENNYKEFLTTFNQWYEEGLFDNNFSTTDSATVKANMLNGVTGAYYGALGGDIGALTTAATEPNFKVSGAPYPSHAKGETPMFGQYVSPFTPRATISTTCKNPDLAMKFLDYGYSEEGKLFMNFGEEGKTYNMVDGYPTYTEEITKNPDGLSMSQALAKYSFGGQAGPYQQDLRYLEQYASLPQQQAAWKSWMATDAAKYTLPTTYIAEEKQKDYASKKTDIDTYAQEMFIKFISGVEPIEKFDVYIENLKSMGMNEVISMQQEAYDRYLNR